MEYKLSSFDYDIIAITSFILLFGHWAFQEILDRKYGMKPTLTTKSQLKEAAAKTLNPNDAFEINCRYIPLESVYGDFFRDPLKCPGGLPCFRMLLLPHVTCSSHPNPTTHSNEDKEHRSPAVHRLESSMQIPYEFAREFGSKIYEMSECRKCIGEHARIKIGGT